MSTGDNLFTPQRYGGAAQKGVFDYLWAIAILTIPTIVCVGVVIVCVYLCLVIPGQRELGDGAFNTSQYGPAGGVPRGGGGVGGGGSSRGFGQGSGSDNKDKIHAV